MPDPRKPALFGFGQYPNLVSHDYATIATTVGSAYVPAGMPLANAKTEEPKELSRLTALDPAYTFWEVTFGTIESDIGGLAAVNINLSPSGRYRFIGGTAGEFEYTMTAPNAIAASTNTAGAVTNIDEAISAPDASYIAPNTVTSAWDVRLSFPTPAVAPTVGAGMASFVLVMQRVATAGTVTQYPVVTVKLYESGALIRQLGHKAVTEAGASGQILIFYFNPSELADSSLANAEVLVSCSVGAGTSGNHYARLDTLSLYTDIVGAFPAAYLYDSGWLASPTSYYAHAQDGPPPSVSAHYFPASTWENITSFFLLVQDDQAPSDPSIGSGVNCPVGVIASTPSGYIQLGVLAAGPALFLSRGIRHGSGPQASVLVEGRGGVTEGGQTYATDVFRRRRIDLDLLLTRAERDALMDGIDHRRGHSGAIYLAVEPDVAGNYQAFHSMWCTAVELGASMPMPVKYQADGTMLFLKTYSFEEKL